MLSDAGAVAIELLHSASLVHDDLPCFDAAEWRRSHQTVHRQFGEAIAILAGDGLIISAFEQLTPLGSAFPREVVQIIAAISRAVGVHSGLIAGQAVETEPTVEIERYHRHKTAALFEAAAEVGAIASGQDAADWKALGLLVGRAYQIADDLVDVVGDRLSSGKEIDQDVTLGRPNIALQIGVERSVELLKECIIEGLSMVSSEQVELRQFIARTPLRHVPQAVRNGLLAEIDRVIRSSRGERWLMDISS